MTPDLVTPQHIALLVLIRQSFLSTLKTTETPNPPCYPLCAFILDRIYDDVTGVDPDLASFLRRLKDIRPTEITDVNRAEADDIADKTRGVKDFFANLVVKKKPDSVMQLFKDLKRRLYTEREDEDRAFEPDAYAAYPIDRRSPIGIFVRRRWIEFSHASYADLGLLINSCLGWCTGLTDLKAFEEESDGEDGKEQHGDMDEDDQDPGEKQVGGMDEDHAPSGPSQPEASTSAAAQLPSQRQQQSSRAAAFDQYQRSRVNGHTFRAHQALHRFFDYRFAEIKERGHLQHALINLAGLHAEERGFEQARMALMEAVRLARQQNDKSTITSCLALMRRIDFMDPEHRIDNSSLEPPDPTALMGSQDHLWQAREAIRLGKPTNVALSSMYRAKASLIPETIGFRFDRFKVRWDAVSSELWTLLGSRAIADVHRDLSLDPDVDLGNERSQQGSLCAVMTAKARELAHCGAYAEALLLLLSHLSAEAHLPKNDMNILQAAVYDVFRVQASREGFDKALDHLDVLDAARHRFKPVDAATDVEQRVHSLLKGAKKLKEAGNVSAALHEVLEAMSLSDLHDPPEQELNIHPAASHGRTLPRLFLHAQVLLADIELEYEASYKSKILLEEIESCVRKMQDPALLAEWAWTMGKACQAADETSKGDLLGQAIVHLEVAAQAYSEIRLRSQLIRVLGDLAMALNTADRITEREEVLKRWKAARDQEAHRTRQEAFMDTVVRAQRWMVSQDVKLCVEEPGPAVADSLQTERAVEEWVAPTFGPEV